MPKIENPPEPGIRPARIQEAPELSDLCVRSKAVWGYDETFMFLARPALAVSPEQIAAGDVWIATDAQGSIAGLVALGPGDRLPPMPYLAECCRFSRSTSNLLAD